MREFSQGADASRRVALLVRVAADGVNERRQLHQMPLALRLQLRSDPQLLHLPDALREARSGPGRCGLTALFCCAGSGVEGCNERTCAPQGGISLSDSLSLGGIDGHV